jgi:hypothetical protein
MTQIVPAHSVTERAAIMLEDAELGIHVGIVYRAAKAPAPRVLHLKWNYQLADDALASGQTQFRAVVPAIDPFELDVLAACCVVRAKQKQDIPFGFRHHASSFAPKDGSFVPGAGETGLTCSTFVLAMLDWARITLIEKTTWQGRSSQRRTADNIFWKKLLDFLRKTANAPKTQLDALESETDAIRFRPEEVAAASAVAVRPMHFVNAEPAGVALSNQFYGV